MKTDKISIAHWIANLAHPVACLDHWCDRVESLLRQCQKKKFDILILPEYISEHWMSFSPSRLKPTEELSWAAEQASLALPRLQAAVRKTGVALLPGSMPWPDGRKNGGFVNRAWMLFPDRRATHHDKLVLIPMEKNPDDWFLQTGKSVSIFKWRGFKMAILICLDIEMPALAHRLASENIDLILVPSMTEKPAGYHRVFSCARARAVELMTAVSVVGCIGGSLKKGVRRTHCHAGAAVYVPSEEAFGHTGIFGEIHVHGKTEGPGKVLWAKDIPLQRIREARNGKAEVWPGPWDADKIKMLKE